jgi:hypothetical protein
VKKKSLKGDLAAVFDEVQVLTGLDHPNVGTLALSSLPLRFLPFNADYP